MTETTDRRLARGPKIGWRARPSRRFIPTRYRRILAGTVFRGFVSAVEQTFTRAIESALGVSTGGSDAKS